MIIGRHEDCINASAMASWRAIDGGADTDGPDARVPSGFATVLFVRAYLRVVSPRPPGNIHRLLSPPARAWVASSPTARSAAT